MFNWFKKSPPKPEPAPSETVVRDRLVTIHLMDGEDYTFLLEASARYEKNSLGVYQLNVNEPPMIDLDERLGTRYFDYRSNQYAACVGKKWITVGDRCLMADRILSASSTQVPRTVKLCGKEYK